MEGNRETSTQTVEVPTATAVETAVVVAEASAISADQAAHAATVAADTATTAALEVIGQIEDDEEWLENQLKEIRTEIQSLRVEATAIPQSLMATLSQQAELIRTLGNQITELSTQVTSLQVPKATENLVVEVPAVVPESGEAVREAAPTPKASEKKRRKI